MKFVKGKKPDESLDLVCRMCPMHLLEFIGMEEDEDYYKFYIKKQRDET